MELGTEKKIGVPIRHTVSSALTYDVEYRVYMLKLSSEQYFEKVAG